MRYVEAEGLRTSVIGLGARQFGSPDWGWGDGFGPAEAQAIVDRARQLGVTLIDTAEIYGRGESERVLGRILAAPGVRDSIVLASKLAPRGRPGNGSWRRRAGAWRALAPTGSTSTRSTGPIRWSPGLDHGGLRALRAGGLIRHVGVSNYALGRWRAAEAALGGPVVSNQVHYNLPRRRPERELLGFAASRGRLIIAYSPLAQGVLAGKYTAGNPPGGARAGNLLFSEENLRRAAPVLDALREVGAGHDDATPSQIALAWVIHHPHVVAIPGAKSVAQVESNAAAADIVLADDEFLHLNQAADRFHRDTLSSATELVTRRARTLLRRP
jgi:aryl-alcohol dehydrogenase-like predicted oxidoreductase